MKKFQNILITSDIDGTLLWEANYVNPKNYEKLSYFLENGGHFALSTGRNHVDVFAVAEKFKEYVNMPCILCNGSYLFDLKTREFINPQYLNQEKLIELLYIIRRDFMGKTGFRASFADGFMVADDDSYILEQLKHIHLDQFAIIRPLSDFANEHFFKAVFIAPPETLKEVEQVARAQFSEDFTFTTSAPHIFEVQPLGVSKNFQFPYLKKLYDGAEIWAIGDFNNDLEMLMGADVAVCPENAVDEVKAIAKYQVCHCKDGALADMIDLIEKTRKS